MGFQDRFYYGQAKLVVKSSGSKVTVRDGLKTWEADVVGGKAEFMLPPTNKYTVGDKAVYLSYGDYKEINDGI